MKTFSILFFLLNTSLYGQVFSNESSPNEKGYTCFLKIHPNDSVDFVYKYPDNVVYAEYQGKVQKQQDTMHFSLTMTLGQYYMKAWDEQEIFILVDSIFAERFPGIRFRYANGDFRRLSSISRKNRGRPVGAIKFRANPDLFSRQKGKDHFMLELPVKDPFLATPLVFTIPYGSNASFVAGRKLKFQAVLQNGSLQTVGEPVVQTGHFTLKPLD